MAEWWTQVDAGYVGAAMGVFFGLMGATLGTLGGMLAPRGVGKPFVLGVGVFGAAVGGAGLIGGVAALILNQPYHVWFPVLLAGVIGTGVFGPLIPVMLMVYRRTERRRLDGAEIGGNL